MRSRKFVQVDVFSSKPTKGNGLAVVVDAEGLTEAQMQDFAAWTNLGSLHKQVNQKCLMRDGNWRGAIHVVGRLV